MFGFLAVVDDDMVEYNLSIIIPVPSEHKFLVLNGSIVNENVKI